MTLNYGDSRECGEGDQEMKVSKEMKGYGDERMWNVYIYIKLFIILITIS